MISQRCHHVRWMIIMDIPLKDNYMSDFGMAPESKPSWLCQSTIKLNVMQLFFEIASKWDIYSYMCANKARRAIRQGPVENTNYKTALNKCKCVYILKYKWTCFCSWHSFENATASSTALTWYHNNNHVHIELTVLNTWQTIYIWW